MTSASAVRARPSIRSIIIWTVVALAGAAAWAVIALARGETISAIWLMVAAVGSYAIGYRFYSKFLAYKVLKVDDTRATPAERLDNGIDFHPTDRRISLGHHFAAIAGAGPLVGPVLATQMGYLPGIIWIVVGAVLAGCVQDMCVMFFSMRRNGKSLGQLAREEVGLIGGTAALIAVFTIMIILLAVLALIVVNALAESPWGVFSIAMTIPIALFMGVYMRYLRPGRVTEVSVIGVILLLLAIVGGGWVSEHATLGPLFTLSRTELVWALVIYGFFASVLPVWVLLAPRDYLSTFMKVGTIGMLAVGILFAAPVLKAAPITKFAETGYGPVFAGTLFPFLFITITCGALSGFHALISSGTTPKLIQKESQVRLVGYGSMAMESFVAVIALIAACALEPGLYYAMNTATGVLGATPETAAKAIQTLGFTITPAELAQAAKDVGEKSILSKTGGAPTLALGMAQIFSTVTGKGMMAFWYHFAIMFEALFILTTVDAGTRVGRFMLQDTLGNIWKPLGRVSWQPGLWGTSAVVVGAWGWFVYQGVINPLGGIFVLFPLFAVANQLLAAIALTVVTTILIKSGRAKWAWITGVPLAWTLAITMTASYQKIFHADYRIGYFAQRERFATALEQGKVLAPAKTPAEMETVINNATVCGVLQILYASLVIIVVLNAIWIWVKALTSSELLPTAEAPYVRSEIVAPSGLFATAEEKREMALAGAGSGAEAGSGSRHGESSPAREMGRP